MGLLAAVVTTVADQVAARSLGVLAFDIFVFLVAFAIAANALKQLLLPNKNEPPLVFHWIPFLGSTISYGIDPYRFFFACRAKHGNVFTFILLGRKVTVCLETDGNDMVLNGKLNEVCAEDVYGPLVTPVFGKDVVYDCPNSKLMEQKKFVKFGLTSEALRSYVPLIVEELNDYIKRSPSFEGSKGIVNVTKAVAEVTLFSAARTLQGKEIRAQFDTSFAGLYHDLDMGFAPINFFIPWAPIPRNIRRDRANKKMTKTYLDIIQARRQGKVAQDSHDMLWNLMSSTYRDGTTPPDAEVAHMMIALLMAGQHSSSSTISWCLLRLATRPEIAEEMYNEQIRTMGPDLPPLTHDSLQQLTLHQNVVRETLRLHAPIHSIMRKVKSPLPVAGTRYTIPPSHTVLAAPGVSARNPEHFPNPETWEPHRWGGEGVRVLGSDEKEDFGYGLVTKGTKSPYLPFGAGRHRCIGEQFAYVQVLTILATFVRQFRFKNLPGRGLVATDYSSLFSGPMNPATVEWERRKSLSASS